VQSSGRKIARRLGFGSGTELRGFAGDTVYVGAWQAATSVADLIQIALITHALGLTDYGRLALVTSVVVLVGKFFDVQVGIAATTYGAPELHKRSRLAGPVFRFSYLIDLGTGLVAVAVLVPVAYIVGPGLVGTDGTLLMLIYSITLLASTVDNSSLAILRLLDRYRLVAGYTVAIEVVRVAMIAVALAVFHSLVAVVAVLALYQAAIGIANLLAGKLAFQRATGEPLFRGRHQGLAPEMRGRMIRTVLHTNVVTYTKLVQMQLPTVVVGALVGPFEAGLYKIGMAPAAFVGRLSDPAYVAILPRLSQLWSRGHYGEVRTFIKHLSRTWIPIVVTAAAIVIALRFPILRAIGGEEATAAAAVLASGVLARAIDGGLFWNASLLFAAGRARAVAGVAIAAAAVQTALLFPLTLGFEATGAGLAFLVSVALANALNTTLAVRVLGQRRHDETTGSGIGTRAPARS
jgi:O-antigen/teichoic acid export membrane protein